jgi:hypothetical protein
VLSVVVSVVFALRSAASSRAALHLEIIALRHQVAVLNRSRPPRLRLTAVDRVVWAAVAGLERLAGGARPRQAGHRTRLAPTRVPPVLDLEESVPYGSSSRGSRGPRVDSSNDRRECALGSATHSWGIAETGDLGESGDRREGCPLGIRPILDMKAPGERGCRQWKHVHRADRRDIGQSLQPLGQA